MIVGGYRDGEYRFGLSAEVRHACGASNRELPAERSKDLWSHAGAHGLSTRLVRPKGRGRSCASTPPRKSASKMLGEEEV
jgi:hypothetical protein